MIERLLDNALDYGIKEYEFWEMTLTEIERQMKSNIRVRKYEEKKQAIFNYIQANLIVKGVSLVLGDKSKYPPIEEVYPELFADEVESRQAKIEEQKMSLSALRFKQYANFHNSKYTKEVSKEINE